MNPDVNIVINIAGASTAVSGMADSHTGTLASAPPPDDDGASQASDFGSGLLSAPGPEAGPQADGVTGGPPGPEAATANADVGAAPPPFAVQTTAGGIGGIGGRGGMGSTAGMAPGPEHNNVAAAAGYQDSAPAPDLKSSAPATSAKKSLAGKTPAKKSRAKKKK